MELKKLAPWTWFAEEEESALPAVRTGGEPVFRPMRQFHEDVDRIFDDFFRSFGLSPRLRGMGFPSATHSNDFIPSLDIAANEKEYTISVEVPGVEEKDLSLDLSEGALRIRGEKKVEKEDKKTNFHRVERSFGSFERTVCLPDDVEEEGIAAAYANGVLTIRLPRKAQPKEETRKIPVNAGTNTESAGRLAA